MTLKDDDIVTTRVASRRSVLSRLGTVVGVAVALVTGIPSAQADTQDYIQKDNKARTPHDQNTRSGDSVSKKATESPKKRDAQDYIPKDNKAKPSHDQNTRSGDSVGK
jgi:hypothetical protein